MLYQRKGRKLAEFFKIENKKYFTPCYSDQVFKDKNRKCNFLNGWALEIGRRLLDSGSDIK